jgi:hypothetical protein
MDLTTSNQSRMVDIQTEVRHASCHAASLLAFRDSMNVDSFIYVGHTLDHEGSNGLVQ